MNRDIWVIIFDNDEEIFLLRKQIESLIKVNNSLSYNIIINEFNTYSTRKKLKRSGIISLLKLANFKTKIYDMCDIVDIEFLHQSQGYINQQILKLQVHTQSNCNEHMILDAKNIITSRYILDTFSPSRHTPPNTFFGCYEYCIQKWHNGKLINVRPFETPYLFKRYILEAMQGSFQSKNKYFRALRSKYEAKQKPFKLLNKKTKNKVACISEFYMYNIFEQRYDRNYTEYLGPAAKINWIFNENFLIDTDVDIVNLHRKTVEVIGTTKSEEIINSIIYSSK